MQHTLVPDQAHCGSCDVICVVLDASSTGMPCWQRRSVCHSHLRAVQQSWRCLCVRQCMPLVEQGQPLSEAAKECCRAKPPFGGVACTLQA